MKFLDYDTTNRGSPWMKLMRIRVELDIDKPLKKDQKIKVGGMPVVVVFKIERLHIFCYICGKLGYTDQYCEILFNSPDGNVPRNWGPDLKVADRRNVQQDGDRWLRDDGVAGDERFSEGESNANFGSNQIPNLALTEGDNRGRHLSQGTGSRKSGLAINDYPKTMMQNPCYDESALEEELNDDYALIDMKKRKRLAQLQSGETSRSVGEEDELMHEKDQLQAGKDGKDHFLTASPGIGACREL